MSSEDLAIVVQSGEIERFVAEHNGAWDHTIWLEFRDQIWVRYGHVDEGQLGLLLEEEKHAYHHSRELESDMSQRNKDYYKVLQIDPSAEPEVITAAYRRLALKYHPDTNPAPDAHSRMQEINEAYEILHDPAKREQYDRVYNATYAQRDRSASPYTAKNDGDDFKTIMSREKAIQLLISGIPGITAWNQYRQDHEQIPDLSGADLGSAALDKANLHGINLSHANLTKASLQGADLTKASLQGADLTKVNLDRATLTNADLCDATLTNAGLRNANLTNANLQGADLSNADLVEVDLRGATLESANLSEANLVICRLDSANLSNANLVKVNEHLSYTTDEDYREIGYRKEFFKVLKVSTGRYILTLPDHKMISTMSGANLNGADLNNADLRWMNLNNANLTLANLNKTKLRGATLVDANLSEANFEGADLVDANLQGANVNGTNFQQTDLRNANLTGVKFYLAKSVNGANIEGAKLK